MNVIVDKQPQCQVSMRVELSKEEVASERRQVVEAFRKQARIPGYRPGKVPLPIIEKRFQKEISEELETRLVRYGCREGIKKEALEVIAVTEVKEPSIHPDDSFSFTAQLQITPDFDLPKYQEIPVEVTRMEVSEEDVNRQMDLLRHRMADFQDFTGRPLQMDDFAVIHYSAMMDGQPLDEAVEGTGFLARGQSQWLRLAPDGFIPGFCDELVGLSAGEKKSFDVTVADDFQVEAVRGKTLRYDVTVEATKERVLPEWTDELAATMGEGMTVESLREKCRESLQEMAQEQRTGEITTQILEFLDKNLEFELPNRVLAHETQRQVNQIVSRIHQRGMSEEQITDQKDAIIQHAATQAEVNVKTAFILRQIAGKEGIQATEGELASYCVNLAAAAGISVKKYIRQLQKSDALEEVVDRVVRAKTLEFLRQKAVITEKTPEPPAPPESPETQE